MMGIPKFCLFFLICTAVILGAVRTLQAFEIGLPLVKDSPGSSVMVPVSIGDISGIRAGNIRIYYDKNIVTAIGVITTGTFTDGWLLSHNIQNTTGMMDIGIAVANHSNSGPGTLILLEFLISSDATGGQVSSLIFDQSVTVLNVDTPKIFRDGSISVNDAPVLGNVEGPALTYQEGSGGMVLTSSVTVADVADTHLVGATVSISENLVGGEDRLLFDAQSEITGTYVQGTGVLTLIGNATVAQYQAALRSVRYENVNVTNPSELVRTVRFRVTDGTDSSNVVTRQVGVVRNAVSPPPSPPPPSPPPPAPPPSPPAADFGVSVLAGFPPLSAVFTDQSTGTITAWNWDFGDGEISNAQNPAHTYTQVGRYTVTLTVSGPSGSHTRVRTDYITVGQPNSAPVWGDIEPQTVFRGEDFVFDVPVTDDLDPYDQLTAEILRIESSGFVEVVETVGPRIVLRPKIPRAIFEIKIDIRVLDTHGAASEIKTFTISWIAPPVEPPQILGAIEDREAGVNRNIILDLGPHKSDQEGIELTWTVTDIDSALISEVIQEGDVFTFVPHSNATGANEIALILTNQEGASDSARVRLTWKIMLEVDFTATPVEGVKPLQVAFEPVITHGTAGLFLWEFGDGVLSHEETPVHIFSKTGIYDVTLSISGSDAGAAGISKTKREYVRVYEQLPAGTIVVDKTAGIAPAAIHLSGVVSPGSGPIDTFLWTLGDGTVAEDSTLTHTYTTAGIFSVTLTMQGPGGTVTIAEENLIHIVEPGGLLAHFEFNAGASPFVVQFFDQSIGNGLTYAWDFGDSTAGAPNTSTAQHPTHAYESSGHYTVKLTVTDTEGRSVSREQVVFVQTPRPAAPVRRARQGLATQPVLAVYNVSKFKGVEVLTYEFQVSAAPDFSTIAASISGLAEGAGTDEPGTTAWRVHPPLGEGLQYYWRARVNDGVNDSPFMNPETFVVDALASEYPGDLNGDFVVDFFDFLVFAEKFGMVEEHAGFDTYFDFNRDGKIDFIDFLEFLLFYNTSYLAHVNAN